MIYDLILSKGHTIKIDEEDLAKIQVNISSNLIRVKQGIFNPSFMVMITPTNEPDIIKKPIIDSSGKTAIITGEREVKVLSDLMSSELKRLN